jgi:hypothetical protein
MTTALKNILARINKMPAAEQNAIAELLGEEIAWQKSFKGSQKELDWLAEEAIAEYKKGKTKPLKLK